MSKKYPCPAGREDDCGYPACAHDRQCELAASTCSAPCGESGEIYYCKKEEFVRYISDEVNPAREKSGLQPLDLKSAEEAYRILNDFYKKQKLVRQQPVGFAARICS